MELLTYLLKVSVCMVLFYAFYLLVLSRLTFFKTNRFYLLATLLLSFIIPSLSFTVEREVVVAPVVYAPVEVANENIQPTELAMSERVAFRPVAEPSFDWYSLLPNLYFVIVACLLAIAFWRLFQLFKHTKTGAEEINGLKIVAKAKGFTNCSFFNYVFIDNKNITDAELQVLLKHEEVHVKQFHSVDKLLLILAKALLWFNPVVYLYDKALEQAHEYEADEATSMSFGTEQYANLLLRLAIAKSEMPLVHNFVKSPIKARIKMLFNSKSKNMKKLMYLLALPVGLGLLWGFTVNVVDVKPKPKNEVSTVKNRPKLDGKLWGKTLKGKVKSVLQTEVGEVLNFKSDNHTFQVYNMAKGKVKPGDELWVSISGTVENIQVKNAKDNNVKELEGPVYGMSTLKTLDYKSLYQQKAMNSAMPFVMRKFYTRKDGDKVTEIHLTTPKSKPIIATVVQGKANRQDISVWIYANGKLYPEKEAIIFNQKMLASLSTKRGYSVSSDYNLPSISNKNNSYVFWFGTAPPLSASAKRNNTVRSAISEKNNISTTLFVGGKNVQEKPGLNVIKTPEVARLLSSTSLKLDTKSDVSYIKNAVMKIGSHDLEADEVAFDKRNKIITAKNGTLKLQDGPKVVERYIIYDLNKGTYITNSTPGNKIQVNSLAYDLLSELYAGFESYKISKIMDRVVLAGKIDFSLSGLKITARTLEAGQNSEKITAHFASLTTKDGVKVIGDVIEFDAVSKDYKVLKAVGEQYDK